MNDYRRVDSHDCGFHIRGYERLRNSVVEPACAPLRHGLAVVIHRGVLAWMGSFDVPEKMPRQSLSDAAAPADALMDVWADMMRPHLEAL